MRLPGFPGGSQPALTAHATARHLRCPRGLGEGRPEGRLKMSPGHFKTNRHELNMLRVQLKQPVSMGARALLGGLSFALRGKELAAMDKKLFSKNSSDPYYVLQVADSNEDNAAGPDDDVTNRQREMSSK